MDKEEHVYGTLTSFGSGHIKAAPDEAVVHLQIVNEAGTAVEASRANATQTQAVVDAVSNEPNHGLATGGLSVRPVTTYDPETRTSSITGFRATNEVTVRTKIGYAGQLFDAGIRNGANQSSGIDFRLQDEGPQRDQALQLAVKEAFSQAKVVAATADIRLAGPKQIEIERDEGHTLHAKALRFDAATTPTIPQDLTISARVRIEFRTKFR